MSASRSAAVRRPAAAKNAGATSAAEPVKGKSGATRKGSSRARGAKSAPIQPFTANADGTITAAPRPGPTWSPTLGDKAMTFAEAQAFIADLNARKFGGRTDWCLPEIGELLSTVDYTRYDPAADPTVFPDTCSSYYWTNTPTPWDPSCVFVVGFYNGYVGSYAHDGEAFLRAVSRAPAGQ